MLWHSKEKQVKGFMLIQFAPALLLFNPKHKHASSSYWHLKDENAHQRMKVHETSSHFNRVSCRHTLYPSLLWCSGQAWRWSACCCCVIHWKAAPVVPMCVCLPLSLFLRFDCCISLSRAVEILSSAHSQPGASWVGWGVANANAQATWRENAHCLI